MSDKHQYGLAVAPSLPQHLLLAPSLGASRLSFLASLQPAKQAPSKTTSTTAVLIQAIILFQPLTYFEFMLNTTDSVIV